MRLPNGYGSIVYLGKKRRRPYAARILIGYKDNGTPLYKYLDYFENKIGALNCLAEYHKNEEYFNKVTLGKIYEDWSNTRYQNVKENTKKMYEFAWSYLSALEKVNIQDIRKMQLQNIVDSAADKSRSTQKQIKSLAVQLFKSALENDLVKQNYAEYIEIKKLVVKEKEIFTDAEIKTMWSKINTPNMDLVLILIFTGLRIGELCDMTKFNVDLKNRVLRGGNKTEAGQKKVVGIYDPIFPLIKKRYENSINYLIEKDGQKVRTHYLRKYMYYPALEQAEIKQRNPHVCRHTFASLLNRFVADKDFLPAMMGHTDKSTTKLYTHFNDEQVYETINLIKL